MKERAPQIDFEDTLLLHLSFNVLLDCLSVRQRLAVRYYFWHGYTLHEIGARLGCSTTRVGQLVDESKAILRQRIACERHLLAA